MFLSQGTWGDRLCCALLLKDIGLAPGIECKSKADLLVEMILLQIWRCEWFWQNFCKILWDLSWEQSAANPELLLCPSGVCSGLFWALLFCVRNWRFPDAAGGALNPLLCLQGSWRCSVHLILAALSWLHRTDNPLFWDHSAKDTLSSPVQWQDPNLCLASEIIAIIQRRKIFCFYQHQLCLFPCNCCYKLH